MRTTPTPPDWFRALVKRVRSVFQPATADREMDDEIAFHLAMETRKLEAAGLTPAEATRQARLAFGGVERFKEDVRADRGFPWLGEIGRDLRFAVRGIRRTPGFALVAVTTLALGIGAATTIFALVDATLLRRLPFPDARQLIHITETNPDGAEFSTSEPNYLDFRDRNTTLLSLGAYRSEQFAMTGRGDPQAINGAAASASLFSTLGVAPMLGRGFIDEDDGPGTPARVVLLSQPLWLRAFGGDSTVVGTTVRLQGEPYSIIGILPERFRLLGAELWVPLGANPGRDRDDHWLGMIGRMRPGLTPDQVAADLARISAANVAAHPEVKGWGATAAPLTQYLVGSDLQRTTLLLTAAVAILLLLACANVANLLLARASARETELAVRLAMGAGRARLTRQLLVESGLLAVLGAVIGLLAVRWIVVAAGQLPPDLVPGIEDLALSPRVLLFSILATLLTTLAAGLAPALGAGRVDLQSSLKGGGRSGTSRRSHRLRELLVVGQVALAMLLLVGGGLMIRSVVRLAQADVGFATEHAWAVPVALPGSRYPEEWQVSRFYHLLTARLAAIPGVTAVGATAVDPFSGSNLVNDVTPEELAADHPSAGYLQASWRVVTPGFFEAAGVPLLRGRDFGDEDQYDRTPVAIISRGLAERLWPGQDPVGKRLFWGGTDGTPRAIIGVAGDLRDVAINLDPAPTMFLTTRQVSWPWMTMIVRADREVPGLAALVREAIWSADAALPVPVVRPLADSRDRAMATPRLGAMILGVFGAAALLLAVVGLYGVLAFAVVERTREIGIRMALGARPEAVLGWLVGRGMRLAGTGIVAGLSGALVLAPFMRGLLYETQPTDPLVLVIVPATLLVVAAIAAWVPGWRATRIDPALAFRAE